MADLDRLLGRPLEVALPADAAASVEVERAADGRWRVTVTLGSAVREVEGETCEAVVRAAAIVLGLAIDPDALTEGLSVEDALPPRSAGPAGPAAVGAGSPSREARPERRPAPEPRVETTATPDGARVLWALGLHGGAGIGPLPGTHPAAGVAAMVSVGRLRVEVGLDWSGATATIGDGPVGGSFDLYTLAPGLCWIAREGTPGLLACGGAEVGTVRSEGVGVSEPEQRASAWAAARAGGVLAWPIGGGLTVAVVATGLWAFERPTFVVEGRGVVHRPSALGGRALLAAEWCFR